jgi:hypothetical protein
MFSQKSPATTSLAAQLATGRLASDEDEVPAGARLRGPRLSAELPSGELFTPGISPLCAGPDPTGACSKTCPPTERPCAGAIWHYRSGGVGWDFVFRSGSTACPVTLLNPLREPYA